MPPSPAPRPTSAVTTISFAVGVDVGIALTLKERHGVARLGRARYRRMHRIIDTHGLVSMPEFRAMAHPLAARASVLLRHHLIERSAIGEMRLLRLLPASEHLLDGE